MSRKKNCNVIPCQCSHRIHVKADTCKHFTFTDWVIAPMRATRIKPPAAYIYIKARNKRYREIDDISIFDVCSGVRVYIFYTSTISKLRRARNAVTLVCTAWWSRVTASRRATSRAFASRTTDSGTAGTPCTWRARGDSSSVIGERDTSSMPKRYPVPVKRKPKTTVSGTDEIWCPFSPREK